MLEVPRKIDKDIKCISFDIFDTAIIRKCYKPTDVFTYIENLGFPNFKQERIEAERLARQKSDKDDIEIYEIYEFLPQYDLQTEVEAEMLFVACNPSVYSFYTQNMNKYKIIFASDMYLPANVLEDLLKTCHYLKYDKVYSSGSLGLCKHNGKMYDYILEVLGLKPNEILHIGDNYNSDTEQAQKKGIKTIYLPNNYNTSTSSVDIKERKVLDYYDEKDISSSVLTSMITRYLNLDISEFRKIGYYFGPLFWAFTEWVVDSKPKDSKLFFNSRDGYLPYVIANEFLQAESQYLRTSRRSVFYCALDFTKPFNHKDNLYIYNCAKYCRFEKLYQLLEHLGLVPRFFAEKIKECGFKSLDEDINWAKMNETDSLATLDKIDNFLMLNADVIYKVAKQNKNTFLIYLEEMRLKEGDVLVDIGWNGSIQHSIQRAANVKLNGRYLEVFKHPNAYKINYETYLQSGDNKCHKYTAVLETLFTEIAGSVIDYDDFGSPSLSKDMASSDKIRKIEEIQSGILSFCYDWHILRPMFDKQNIYIDREYVENLVFRFLKAPTLREVQTFGNISFENGHDKHLETLVNLDLEAISQGNLTSSYKNSYWKEGFLKTLESLNLGNLKEKILITEKEYTIDEFLEVDFVKSKLVNLKNSRKRFMFYGCGRLAEAICKKYPSILKNPYFLGFIDSKVEKSNFLGKPINRISILNNVGFQDVGVYLTVLDQDYVYGEIESSYRQRVEKLI